MNAVALKNLADWVSRKFGVTVVFSPEANTASTNLKTNTIYLPTFVPDELAHAFTALIDHEAQHLKDSDPGGVPEHFWRNIQAHQCLNILEDIRINADLAKQFPNYRSLMKSFFDLIYDKPEKFIQNESTDPKTGIVKITKKDAVGKILTIMIFKGNNMPYPALKGFENEYNEKKDFFNGIIERTLNAEDIGQVVLLAEELYKELFGKDTDDFTPPIGPQPDGDDGEGEDEGEGDGKPGKKPGKDEGEGEDEGEGDGKPGKGDGKPGKDEGEGEGEDEGEGDGKPGKGDGKPGKDKQKTLDDLFLKEAQKWLGKSLI